MYLISVEGGDGSGKGLATSIVAEILEKEFTFTSVEKTGEPRREHPLGRLAIESVKMQTLKPEGEAGLFAADRLDHSHGWILPYLKEGRAVVSERNIHSSLVYQGIVGKLGLERVAHMNSAALIPDLCIWVDCDPEIALKRIEGGTLRNLSDKKEYFETSDLQKKIRAGYKNLLSGELEMPIPFDMGALVGPILNETSEIDFRKKLNTVVKNFLHSKPLPINVQVHDVEIYHLTKLLHSLDGQSTLENIGLKPLRNNKNWLNGEKPWKILLNAQKNHNKKLQNSSKEENISFPKSILSHSISSICGTLSLMNSADISELREALGPVRNVSYSHTRKIIRFLHSDLLWLTQTKTLLSGENPKSRLKDKYYSLGRLLLVIWPIKSEIKKWQRKNPNKHLRFSLPQIIKENNNLQSINSMISRLNALGDGREEHEILNSEADLIKWWKGN
ncbi:MAG: dTMP kinase [Candidatus Thalassarchaeaceae archaeon]